MAHSAIPAKAGIQRNIERGTRTLQSLADRPSIKMSAKRAHYSLDSRLRGNGGVGTREGRSGLYALDGRGGVAQPDKQESIA